MMLHGWGNVILVEVRERAGRLEKWEDIELTVVQTQMTCW